MATQLKGVDVSSYQGKFDWAAWKKNGIAWGIAKATEGKTIHDSQFARNWSEMKANGLPRGAYHFAHPSNDPLVEAQFFIDAVNAAGGFEHGDVAVLDLEATDGLGASRVSAYARAWCAKVERITGITPIVYTYIGFANEGNCDGLGRYPLWIADPSASPGKPRIPSKGPWTTWVMHQYAETGGVDRDVLNGDEAFFKTLGSSTGGDDMVDIVSTGSDKQTVPAGKDISVKLTQEHSDIHGHHGDGGYSVIVTEPMWANCAAFLDVVGLKDGDTIDVSLSRMVAPKKSGDPWTVDDDAWRVPLTAPLKDGKRRLTLNGSLGLDKDHRLRLRLYNGNSYDVDVTYVRFVTTLAKYK